MKIFISIAIIFAFFIFITAASAEESKCVPDYQCGAWSQCENGLATRTCTDISCNEKDVTERSFCDDPGCTPSIDCDSWGPCTYTQKTNDLINGKVGFTGYRYRTCRDENKCIPAYQQEGACEENTQLLFSPIEKCGERYLALIDPLSKEKLAEFNLDSWLHKRLDLAFTQGETKYCSSCYNSVKDNDEEGIDCGGENCQACKKENYLLYALSLIFVWSGSIVFSFLSVREFITLKGQIASAGEMAQ